MGKFLNGDEFSFGKIDMCLKWKDKKNQFFEKGKKEISFLRIILSDLSAITKKNFSFIPFLWFVMVGVYWLINPKELL